jgi:hypothetical protein
MPALLDVIRSLFRPQVPGDVATVADLVIRGQERDLAFSTQLIGDLPVERLLVGLNRQEAVGPLLLELSKNGRCVWSASAWMSTPSRSSSPIKSWSIARSWSTLVA